VLVFGLFFNGRQLFLVAAALIIVEVQVSYLFAQAVDVSFGDRGQQLLNDKRKGTATSNF
jgi:hypothetical protein